MEDEFVINEFHPEIVAPSKHNYRRVEQGGSKLVFIGKPGTGKSTLIRYIIYSKMDVIPVAVAMNGTEKSTGFYSEMFPPLFVYDEYRDDVVTEFIKRQDHAKKNFSNPWAMLVVDDCTDNKNVFKSENQQGLFKNGRHWKMLYILSLQYCIDLPPAMRTCVDGTFIFRETNEKNLKNLYDNFAGVFPSFGLFKTYMEQVTGDYTALYIDQQNQATKEWFDCVYFVKAPIVPEFKFGCKEYRAFAKDRTDKKFLVSPKEMLEKIQEKYNEGASKMMRSADNESRAKLFDTADFSSF